MNRSTESGPSPEAREYDLTAEEAVERCGLTPKIFKSLPGVTNRWRGGKRRGDSWERSAQDWLMHDHTGIKVLDYLKYSYYSADYGEGGLGVNPPVKPGTGFTGERGKPFDEAFEAWAWRNGFDSMEIGREDIEAVKDMLARVETN